MDTRRRRASTAAEEEVGLSRVRIDGTGMSRPDLDDEPDEHADEASIGYEAAWPEPARLGRVAQIGCDLGPLDASRPATVVSPGDQTAWQAHGGAAAEKTGR